MPISEKPTILVVGAECLNNSYLGVRLELDGFNVDYSEFQDFVETPPEKLQNHFCLIDFQCKKRDVILGGLGVLAQAQDTENTRYALFNACPDHIDQKTMIDLARRGLVGLFFDGEKLEIACRGVRLIMEGEIWLPKELMTQLILTERVSSPSGDWLVPLTQSWGAGTDTCAPNFMIESNESVNEQKVVGILTVQEKKVLAKLTFGLNNQEIAEQLFISIPTVKSHINNIYDKIGVSDRLQAALWMAKNG